MAQESPAGADVLNAYRKRVAERKGRRRINALPTTKGSDARAHKGLAGPSHKSKKKARDGGNIATTTRSPGFLPTPPPRWDAVEVDSSSSKHVGQAAGFPETEHVMEVSMSPLALLGGDFQFTRRVRVALPEKTRDVIWGVPSSDLLRGGLEMLCCSVVMVQLEIKEREHHVEEISRLDHQLAEASDQQQQSLAANFDLSKRSNSEVAEKEKARWEVAEVERLLGKVKAEIARVATKNTHLKKMVEERDEKLSSSGT